MRARFSDHPTPRKNSMLWGILVLGLLVASSAFASGPSPSNALVAPALKLPSLEARAEATDIVEEDLPQLRARLLVSDVDTQTHVGVLFDLAPGWHLYWRNPGGTGIAPDLTFDTDAGTRASVGDIAWPSPQTFEEAGGLFTTWGYEGSVLLSAPLVGVSGSAARPATSTLSVNARVLVCRTQCVPAEFELSSSMQPRLTAIESQHVEERFRAALSRVPGPATAAGVVAQAEWQKASPALDETERISVTIETCRAEESDCARVAMDPGQPAGALFLPISADTFEYDGAQANAIPKAEGRYLLEIEATRLEAGADRLRGLIPLRDASGMLHHVELDVPIDAAKAKLLPAAPAVTAPPSMWRWIQIFGLALLGGLILNGMPCVLPVLAIKVVAIADMAEQQPREVRMNGLAYTGGVLASMGTLAAIVLSLRAAGHSVGWGFQFQEPLFVAAISALLVAFAMNLFGVFEIELGQGRLAAIGQDATGLRRSALEGLLAVVLATPCTAPFLGTAVGFAFASEGFGILAIFLAIGLGLASPFLLVSFNPAFSRFIPRSGAWMNTLRAGLGFSLLATVVWLLWVLGQSGGVDSVVATCAVLLALAFLLWGFGQMQPLESAWRGRGAVLAITAIAAVGMNRIEFDRIPEATDSVSSSSAEHAWATYSEEAVQEALAAGQPAFVVFTADWCITCQVNERTVLARDSVLEAFEAGGYALFKADWTRRDESIRRTLAGFGRAGVPLYLVYQPDAPGEPEVLSELLSTSETISALGRAAAATRI